MLNYAIIGFGGLGKLHLVNLIQLEQQGMNIHLCAICGADPSALKENVKLNLGEVDLSKLDFSDCSFYQDYKELIEKEKPDFILSTLPTYLYEEVAVCALSKGIHVFSEKPTALSLSGCEKMINEAKKSDKKLMIGQYLRFDPAYRKIKEYVDNETFGKAYREEFTRYSQKPVWSWNNWILKPEKSGGCIFDMHIHDVDLINWIFGMPESVRSAMTERKVKREAIFSQYFYEDLLVLSNADWSMTQTFPFEARCLINFDEATVVLSDGKLIVYKDDESFSPELADKNYFVEEMKAFLEEIIDGNVCETTSLESVYKSVCLAFAEIESAGTGEQLDLKDVIRN